ncbi:hypothetical protein KL930_004416 [Ogataea haglerorum]|uniref:Trafficking protein particle complex subunit n=1 Tax=Ogataea haglerorum TaxID=1937702 RepID=A0AAN6D411_9ASCO|nr:uncharacterized protein KL911_004770 [Ogataea haglerorum]KAG7692600.1 hypothetical protein KL915_004647 [Ogataea haglerorum]KAG7692836.1 hypothetical protein KL951_004847 [Ogataea haglerorum]KAG7703547.1 hypothetical protein KL950_004775 [Ogataea haglerorum]KAG7725328.1 hypothetical protein KL933_004342 [Ogataea haglerorum]KAG7727399.1 hypothetical protein KL948_004548 [Ogataea haglerorum]
MSRSASGYDPAAGPRTTGTTTVVRPRSSIYDRNLHRTRHEISVSSLSFLFMEIVSMNLNQAKSLIELERKLNNLGYSIGAKVLELASLRENFNNNLTSSGKSNMSKREIKVLEILHFITSVIWPSLFEKPADNLEKSSESNSQYMIIDNAPLLMKYISVPKEYEGLNCEAFVAGIVEGILDSTFFKCEVSAHTVPLEGHLGRTVYLINFDEELIALYNRRSNVLKPKSTNIITPRAKAFEVLSISPEASRVIGQSTLDALPGARTPPMLVYSSSSVLNENNLSVTSTPFRAPIVELPEHFDDEQGKDSMFVNFLSRFERRNSRATKKVGFEDQKDQTKERKPKPFKKIKKQNKSGSGDLLGLNHTNHQVTRFLAIDRKKLKMWTRREFELFVSFRITG